jgi:hypothetical protein
MIAQPALEWPVVAAEPATTTSLLRGYVVPLAIIGPICQLAGALIFAHRSIVVAMAASVLEFVLEIVAVFVVAFIADALITSFGGTKDSVASFKWVAYSSTARWVAGIFQLLPAFGPLIVLVASLYTLYTLFLGSSPVMRVAPDRAAGFTVVVVVTYIVVMGVFSFVAVALLGILFAGAAVATGALTH